MKIDSKKPRALIFEDDDALRDALKDFLKWIGFEVVSFPDPCESSLCSNSQCPCQNNQACADVIITDIRMPCISGYELMKGLLQKGCKIRNVMVMSGDFTSWEFQQSKEAGFYTVEKPFRFNDIRDWLEDCKNNIDLNRELTSWYVK